VGTKSNETMRADKQYGTVDSEVHPTGGSDFRGSVSRNVNVEKSKVLNALAFVLMFVSWTATCAVFGGALHTTKITPASGTGIVAQSFTLTYYYNHVVSTIPGFGTMSTSYSSWEGPCQNKCLTGGQGLVAMSVFAFLTLMFSLALIVLRMMNREHMIPMIGERKDRYFRAELFAAFMTTFFFFLMSVIWGGTCYNCTVSAGVVTSASATGFAFVCVCEFFMISVCVLLYFIRKEELGQTEETSRLHGAGYQTSDIAAAKDTGSENFPSAMPSKASTAGK